MKHATKSVIAITTLINGRINYISAHSVRDNGSFLPQFDIDAQKAKEFDSMAAANEYLKKVFNPFHRMFTVVHIDILDIVESKNPFINFDRSIKKLATIIIITLVTLTSCSKAQVPAPPSSIKHPFYQLYVEQYTLDSTFVKKYIWWQDTVSRPSEQIKIDTLHPRWFRICNANLQPTHLEYTYYTRNGIKIQ